MLLTSLTYLISLLFVGQSPIVSRRFTGKAMAFYYCANSLKTADFNGQNTHQKLKNY